MSEAMAEPKESAARLRPAAPVPQTRALNRLQAVREIRETYRVECARAGIDYVPMDTSISFDKALMEYLLQRQRRF